MMICPKCGTDYEGNFCPNGCNSPAANTPQKKGSAGITTLTVLLLIFFFPAGLILMWTKAKNWNVAVKVVITVLFAIACIGVVANMGSDDGQPGTPTQTQTDDSGTQAATPENTDSTTKLGDYEVEALSARLATNNSKPVVIIKYRFTNNYKDAKSFALAISDKVFQNGIECEQDYFVLDLDDYDSSASTKDVQSGGTYELEIAYELNDTTSDVVVECSELISFSNKKYTKTFSIS